MMHKQVKAELDRYGRKMTLYTREHPEGVEVKAMLQPVRDRRTAKAVPSPLGWVVQDRFIYIGPAEVALEGSGCRLTTDGADYRLRTAQPVYAGGVLSHWWAVFQCAQQEVR